MTLKTLDMKIDIINPVKVKRISCRKCSALRRAELHVNNGKKMIVVRKAQGSRCPECSMQIRLISEQVDVVQPSSQLWDLVYDDNIFEQTQRGRRERLWAEEKRKENLDQIYDKKFTKPWERKFVKNMVLRGGI